ncbi:MAG TPA: ectoine/hydroxyectoine ABC transporter permease subunit EhuD [Segeticoccus sp.]|nr:ectoine/hydroxyectoine ABC transporter permease subunit EhuD [Segeticoccus sp.]
MFDVNYFLEVFPTIARAFQVTIEVTAAGIAVAMVLGLFIDLGRRTRIAPVRWVVEFIRDFIQNTPLILQAFFFFWIFPQYGGFKLDALLSGIIVIGIQYAAYTAEVYRAGIDAVPAGQWQAARALNFSRADTWRRIILPQAIPPIFPALGNYLISMLKDTPQLLVIGVLGMAGTAQAIGNQTYEYGEPMVVAGIIFVIASYILSLGVRRLEARFGRLT